jgi:hypothetical protein
MAVRVTAAEVKVILDNTALSDTDIDAYIVGANALVNSVLGTGTEDILTEIEKWLTAHMIASTRERQAIKEGAGGASITYSGNYDTMLSSTSYGQMVMTLDSTGLMAALGMKAVRIIAIKSFDE